MPHIGAFHAHDTPHISHSHSHTFTSPHLPYHTHTLTPPHPYTPHPLPAGPSPRFSPKFGRKADKKKAKLANSNSEEAAQVWGGGLGLDRLVWKPKLPM